MAMIKNFNVDRLAVKVYETRAEMGAAAAADAERTIVALLEEKDEINMIFAAAPSQNEVLANLLASDRIDWTRINAFHMDEYVGLPEGDPHSFGVYLKEHIFAHKPFKSVHYIRGWAEDAAAECARYSALLRDYPTDVICLGIGENGHIAFNDPWVAKFDDEQAVKVVPLDEVCRQQQVNDGCFPTLDDVPTHALTLTLPTLFAAKHLFCAVPAPTKAAAVKNTVQGEIGEDCPATIMRRHASATLYCDADSGALI